jgi:16S rRNA (guanine527-N7)-methyltransferase
MISPRDGALAVGASVGGGLSERQIDQLATILKALTADDLAPTTVRDPARAADVHLADSLIALELELVRSAATIADIGAGAGFPGLPLAVALPRSQIKLIESRARKCEFIERTRDAAQIENV